ncbi:helix-turn-helix domain-containing protein [Occallatibacter savannae]|uniref:helix-turn-helix domain-containing protein n=1 Tax=Occallatibacter savannae TaxID=1002691 RepID=UPI000D692AFF
MNENLNPEPFVDATRAAEFLGIKPRRLLEMARAGQIPGHPLGTGARRTWRFRLSEIAREVESSR